MGGLAIVTCEPGQGKMGQGTHCRFLAIWWCTPVLGGGLRFEICAGEEKWKSLDIFAW